MSHHTPLFYFRYFCETLLDFYDPCPVKEELRNKIVSRLLREGSSADEPSNIAMSDYSSLSSGCESSSDDEDANKGIDNRLTGFKLWLKSLL